MVSIAVSKTVDMSSILVAPAGEIIYEKKS